MSKGPQHVALIGSYPPGRCGIATFTHDLYDALAEQQKGKGQVYTIAINDTKEGYPYPPEVRLEIKSNELDDYRMASDFLNIKIVDGVILQHEYGIFGGPSGTYILNTLSDLRVPVLTTLHTILREPNDEQKAVMEEVINLSERVVVMSERGIDMLADIYGAPREKLVLIPHGIPDVPFVDPNYYKDQFGVEGRKVLLTFGLLSPGKGIEHVIQALPEITSKFPEVTYLILGVTHPHVKKHHGEEYRLGLQRMAEKLGVKDHVFFLNRFVELEELCQCIGAADIYVTPYLKKEQITSGTLSYALGAGKAVVSTPYWHAEELLADDRGKLIPFEDPDAIARAVTDLLGNELEFNAMRRRAYQYCRNMVWSKVGRQYLKVCRQVMTQRATKPRVASAFSLERPKAEDLPAIDLRHVRRLTDDTGVLQHATYTVPNRDHGYTTDDNARALIVACRMLNLTKDETLLDEIHIYLGFLLHAFNSEKRRFRNFMSYDRQWLEAEGSEDSLIAALALGQCVGYVKNDSIVGLCMRLFNEALPPAEQFTSPRALAYSVLGIQDYLRVFGGDATVRRMREALAQRLQEQFDGYASDEWPWLEDTVTYSNALLPHALMMSGQWIPDSHMVETGLKALRWLLEVQTGDGGCLSIVGNNGWCPRGGEKAKFDQQPIEAMILVHACLEAHNITQEKPWLEQARRCFHWFLGRNDLGAPLYDFETGGCRDGLHPNGVNANQGAESTLAWLLALTALHKVRAAKPAEENPPQTE